MKKIIHFLLLAVLLIGSGGCYKDDLNDLEDKYNQLAEDMKTYMKLVQAMQDKLYITKIEQSAEGYAIHLSNGTKLDLKNGKDGKAPLLTIGHNGNWFVDGVDTGKPSKGPAGDKPTITIGGNGNWFIDGVDTGIKAQGSAGEPGKEGPKIIGIVRSGNQMIFYFSNGKTISVPLEEEAASGPRETLGIYVLCEGLMGENNSAISYYDIATGVADKDYFKTVNGYGLGETANDLTQYGSKMYVAVTGIQGKLQSAVEIIDIATCKSLKRIPFEDGTNPRLPRFIATHKNKVYVASYDGTVTRIDTASLKVEARVQAGGALEGITVSNNKLYVANSNHPFHPIPNPATVSVIDIASFTKLYEIPTGYNPTRAATASNGDVYVGAWGSYTDPNLPANVTRINTQTDDPIPPAYGFYVHSMTPRGDTMLMASDFQGTVKIFNTQTQQLGGDFITDGTSINTPYGITVNKQNGDVVIADAIWYSGGEVFCFDKSGKLKFKFLSGPLPQHSAFKYK